MSENNNKTSDASLYDRVSDFVDDNRSLSVYAFHFEKIKFQGELISSDFMMVDISVAFHKKITSISYKLKRCSGMIKHERVTRDDISPFIVMLTIFFAVIGVALSFLFIPH